MIKWNKWVVTNREINRSLSLSIYRARIVVYLYPVLIEQKVYVLCSQYISSVKQFISTTTSSLQFISNNNQASMLIQILDKGKFVYDRKLKYLDGTIELYKKIDNDVFSWYNHKDYTCDLRY